MKKTRLEVTPAAAVALALAYYLDDSGWFSAAVPAILCHEMGHWIAIRLLGGRVTSLRVELAGLCMESSAFPDRASEVLALASGPIFGLLWGVLAGAMGSGWGEKSRAVSLALNLYNLLPALPLDGGRILLALTGSARLLRWTGGLSAAALLLLAIWNGRWLMVLPSILLGIHVWKGS